MVAGLHTSSYSVRKLQKLSVKLTVMFYWPRGEKCYTGASKYKPRLRNVKFCIPSISDTVLTSLYPWKILCEELEVKNFSMYYLLAARPRHIWELNVFQNDIQERFIELATEVYLWDTIDSDKERHEELNRGFYHFVCWKLRKASNLGDLKAACRIKVLT